MPEYDKDTLCVIQNYEGDTNHPHVGSIVRVIGGAGGDMLVCETVRSDYLRKGDRSNFYKRELRPYCMFHGGEHEHS